MPPGEKKENVKWVKERWRSRVGNVAPHECQYIAALKRWAVFHFHCHTWRSCCISEPLVLRLLKDHCSVRLYEQWLRAMWKLSLVMINPLYRVSAPDSAVSRTCVEPFQLSEFGLLASACVPINNAPWSWFVNKSQSLLLTSMHCEYPWDLTNMLTVFTKPFLPPLRELFSPLLAHSLICLFVCQYWIDSHQIWCSDGELAREEHSVLVTMNLQNLVQILIIIWVGIVCPWLEVLYML